jgi:hypothetical protein
VRGVEGLGDLPDDGHRLPGVERPALVEQGAQVRPLDVAHRDEEVATDAPAS